MKDRSVGCRTTRRRSDGLTRSTAAKSKKKPKAEERSQPSLSPLSEPPQNVEVIRKPRKERTVVEDDAEEG